MKKSIFKFSASFVFACAALFLIPACTGEDGEIGPAGPAGPTGSSGSRGATGAAGADGTNGTNGTNGADGQDGNSYEDYFNDLEDASGAGMNFYGDAGWFVGEEDVTNGDAVRDRDPNTVLLSGDITDNQIVGLSFQLNNEIKQIVEFDVWISSEICCDYIEWFVGQERVNGIAGEGGPFHFKFEVPAGSDSISFIYDKDGSVSIGRDNTFLDNFHITNYSTSGRVDMSMPDLPETVRLYSDQNFEKEN